MGTQTVTLTLEYASGGQANREGGRISWRADRLLIVSVVVVGGVVDHGA